MILRLFRASCVLLAAAAAFGQAPPNDDPVNAQSVAGGLIVIGTTVAATGSGAGAAAPTCGSWSGTTPDVWYLIQPITAGPCVVETCDPGAASFDTMIAVYILSPTGACIACNDDTCGVRSRVAFTASAGLPYYVRVGGYNGASGEFRLSVLTPGFPPVNDDCANAIAITTPEVLGTTYLAASNPAETAGLCSPADRSVWYSWTNPFACPMNMTASFCSNEAASVGFDSVIGVWSGTCGARTLVACNDDSCGVSSRLEFTVPGNSTYLISIGAYAGLFGNPAGGNFDLTFYGSSAEVTYLGTGCALTPGGPTPGLGSIPINAGYDAFLYVGGAAPNGLVELYLSGANGAPFSLGGCTVYLDLASYQLVTSGAADGTGQWTFFANIPPDPSLVCLEFMLQAASYDPGGGIGITNGTKVRVGYQLY